MLNHKLFKGLFHIVIAFSGFGLNEKRNKKVTKEVLQAQ